MSLFSISRLVAVSALVGTLSGCMVTAKTVRPEPVVARWDHRPEAALWTAAKIDALEHEGAALVETVPQDIAVFCPGYQDADEAGRKAFWVALFSGLAGYESTWRPEAAGAGGRYRGLLQIWPTSAQFHGCDISNPNELYDGAKNLRCASLIAAKAVARDQVVAGKPGAWGGVAADWAPLRDARKRADIAGFTRALPACQV
ncbi:MAG: lytic transglycosylase [Roseinatronobacter sp.]